MNKHTIIRIIPVIILMVLISCATKEEFKDEFEENKTWVEQQTHLPDFPEMHRLIEFDAGSITDYQHSVDPDSIDIGEDGVVRFTLVTRSSAGAMNISFEGIRCETNERKLYAMGRDDQTWSKPRQSEWVLLSFVRQLYAQRELSKHLFCPHKQTVNSPQEAIRALRKGIHPSVFR